MIRIDREKIGRVLNKRGGLAAWLVSRLQSGAYKREHSKKRLTLLDRISLAPRQSLALVEVEGRRLLVGTSQDGGPVFYSLDGSPETVTRPAKTCSIRHTTGPSASASARVSW